MKDPAEHKKASDPLNGSYKQFWTILWVLNSGSLEEQPVLLSPELSLQPHNNAIMHTEFGSMAWQRHCDDLRLAMGKTGFVTHKNTLNSTVATLL